MATSRPVVVEGCFGWLHRPTEPQAASDVAVVLCPALGWDGLHAHHGFRLLADHFASAGHPVLRFQYPGTGDSRDLDSAGRDAAGHWAVWQRSVHDAADWLLATTGARRLILVGLRFGATLATAVAADRADTEGLVLLAPVLRGKSYIRQLDMEARLESGASAAGSGLEFHELAISATTVATISAVDLREAELPAGVKVAVLPQAPSALVEACLQAWLTKGVQVECLQFDGLGPLLQEAIHCDPPVPDFTGLLAWLRRKFPAPGAGAATPATPWPEEGRLLLPGCMETPWRFGAGGRLFGILCQPSGPVARRAVIIGNTGRDPHYGIARLGVQLARHLASLGIASLRIDFAGLGDSPAVGDNQALSSLFEADRTGDISAAIDMLQEQGYREFTVQGVCSGAYHAFRAIQADARIDTVLLVNLPVFQWQAGDTVKAAMHKALPPGRLLARLADVKVWRRVVRGQLKLGPTLKEQVHRIVAMLTRPRPADSVNESSPAQVMASLARRHVRALFLYSENDPGLDTLALAFGPRGERLAGVPGVDLRIVPGLDHVLSARQMRAKAVNALVGFLVDTTAPHATTQPERLG